MKPSRRKKIDITSAPDCCWRSLRSELTQNFFFEIRIRKIYWLPGPDWQASLETPDREGLKSIFRSFRVRNNSVETYLAGKLN